jgi:adenosine deaminase
LSQEYFLVAEHFGLDEEELRRLSMRAIDAIFAGPEQRTRLLQIFNEK